jgi:hypothetical protein
MTSALPLEKTLKDARDLATRFQDGQGFRHYVSTRMPLVIPTGLLFLLISIACAAATVIFLAERHPMLALPGLLLAPLVLVGSLFVQVYVFGSWLENRALARALGHRKNAGIDLGELPPVPWTVAAIFLLAPLALLAVVSAKAALVLIVLAVLIPVLFDRIDR